MIKGCAERAAASLSEPRYRPLLKRSLPRVGHYQVSSAGQGMLLFVASIRLLFISPQSKLKEISEKNLIQYGRPVRESNPLPPE
ncbi:hypothetical protein MTP99_003655 [Tenebrio molitor]|nr:hypothetical protein MTP99_003655 [Tenebrio molitor]